ncbi:hypothetical protein BC629DRAFT_1435038 [Irpex lacteus]|nr:hypothetical protein BC629DRAFT_1435038 [Irpex lacteus]
MMMHLEGVFVNEQAAEDVGARRNSLTLRLRNVNSHAFFSAPFQLKNHYGIIVFALAKPPFDVRNEEYVEAIEHSNDTHWYIGTQLLCPSRDVKDLEERPRAIVIKLKTSSVVGSTNCLRTRGFHKFEHRWPHGQYGSPYALSEAIKHDVAGCCAYIERNEAFYVARHYRILNHKALPYRTSSRVRLHLDRFNLDNVYCAEARQSWAVLVGSNSLRRAVRRGIPVLMVPTMTGHPLHRGKIEV